MKDRFRTGENYDRDQASLESGFATEGPSLTKQSFADECDINAIVKRFGLGYSMPEGVRMPQYGDFTDIVDFHTACNAVAAAREAFAELPAEVRSRFKNDPGAFVEFCAHEENREEAIKLGLVPPPESEPLPEPKASELPPKAD